MYSVLSDRILVVKNEKRNRIALYSICIDPSNTHLFAVSGRDQFARYVHMYAYIYTCIMYVLAETQGMIMYCMYIQCLCLGIILILTSCSKLTMSQSVYIV